jgi:uncharacterized phiE125 gp8 family phage protein
MRVLPRYQGEPATEPVTLAQLRGQVRADDDSDDAMLWGYLIAARTMVEQWLGRALVPRTVTAVFEEWPGAAGNGDDAIELLMPVNSVDSITYTDAEGAVVPWTGFVVRQSQGGVTRVRPGANECWPTLGDDPVITLTATAGFAVVPEPIVTAIIKMAAYLQADRDGIGGQAMGVGEIPRDVKAMVAPWRWRWLG